MYCWLLLQIYLCYLWLVCVQGHKWRLINCSWRLINVHIVYFEHVCCFLLRWALCNGGHSGHGEAWGWAGRPHSHSDGAGGRADDGRQQQNSSSHRCPGTAAFNIPFSNNCSPGAVIFRSWGCVFFSRWASGRCLQKSCHLTRWRKWSSSSKRENASQWWAMEWTTRRRWPWQMWASL